MCPMTGSTHLSTWVDAQTKQRFSSAAARQGLSESEEAIAPLVPVDLRDTRVTIRLVPEDRALLRERAAARMMPAATYVSMLVRAHLRQLAPLPDRELSALRSAVNELAVLGRNLNTIARFFQQGRREVVPGSREVYAMLKICEGLRARFRELIKANLVSWELGRAENAG